MKIRNQFLIVYLITAFVFLLILPGFLLFYKQIAIKNMFIFSFATGIVVILSGIFHVRRISRPFTRLKNMLETMANADMDNKLKDSNELFRLMNAMDRLVRRFREDERVKGAMLSQFTHEMKSPLGSIKQATNLLDNSFGEKATAEQKRYIAIIRKNNDNLQRLITNILHSSSYESNRLKLTLSEVNLVQLLTQVIVFMSPVIKEKGQDVKFTFSARDIIISADRDKLEEVFQNLISNAVKFSEKNKKIHITVAQHTTLVKITVSDEGIGIPDQEQPYIFEKLFRASNSKRISVKGTGLGLYIVSQIIRAHGGEVEVQSKENAGTSFRITLPVKPLIRREETE